LEYRSLSSRGLEPHDPIPENKILPGWTPDSTREVANNDTSLTGEVSGALPDQFLNVESESQPGGSQDLPDHLFNSTRVESASMFCISFLHFAIIDMSS